MNRLIRFLPLIFLLSLMLIAYFSGITENLTFENLKEYRHQLKAYVDEHRFQAPLIFILSYIAVAALSLPVAIYLTLLGGFLFVQPLSTLYVVIGASFGGSIVFLAARTALGDLLRQKASPFLGQMEVGFKKNAVNYMLFLRLFPIFPFWLVNLAPAFFSISLWTFFWTTFVGIIPATFVFTQVGAGLGAIFDTEGSLSLSSLLNWDVKIALCALGIFVLLPAIYNLWKSKKRNTA